MGRKRILEPLLAALARRHRFAGRPIGDFSHPCLSRGIRAGQIARYGKPLRDHFAVAEAGESLGGPQYPVQGVLAAGAEESGKVEAAGIGFGGAAALRRIAETEHGIARGEKALPCPTGYRGPVGLPSSRRSPHEIAPSDGPIHHAERGHPGGVLL